MTFYFSCIWTLIPPSAVLHQPYLFINFTPAYPVQQGASRCLLINPSYFYGNVPAESDGGQNLDASCWPSWFHQAALLLHHVSDAALLCPRMGCICCQLSLSSFCHLSLITVSILRIKSYSGFATDICYCCFILYWPYLCAVGQKRIIIILKMSIITVFYF